MADKKKKKSLYERIMQTAGGMAKAQEKPKSRQLKRLQKGFKGYGMAKKDKD